jgi:vacuolar-type H+-ATPase subunit H
MNDGEQEKAVKSIEKVQEAESTARLILDEARKRNEKRLSDAQLAALKVLDDSEAATNKAVEAILKKAEDELAQLRRKKLADARKTADKLRRASPGKHKLEKFAAQAANEIIGA